jgi:hypothetical protein
MGAYSKRLSAWWHEVRTEFFKHHHLILLSLMFFVLAMVGNWYSSAYVDRIPTTSVHDIVLDNLPTMDMDFIFMYGLALIVVVIFFYTAIFRIKEAHIVLSQFGILILIRSFFIILTHLGKPADALELKEVTWWYSLLNYNNDLFFSGHTATPFMAFLIFRKEKIGMFFLLMTFVMAFTVLAMHVHYSIDVFSAFFITYGSYTLGRVLLKKINY